MSKLVLKDGTLRKLWKAYYEVTLFFETMSGNDETTLELKFDKEKVDNNYKEFIEFLKFLYVCHYTSDDTKGCLEGFDHVKEYSYFVEDSEEITKSIFAIDIPECKDYECHYRFRSIEMKYIDDCIYNVSIEFDEKDIKDITDKIKKYHTIKYGWCFGKFSKNDPEIFEQTYDKMRKAKIRKTKN